jgi:transmembrane protein
MAPNWVNAITDNRLFQILARIILTTPFWAAFVEHGMGFGAWTGTMAHFNLNPPIVFAIFTLLTLLVGTITVVFTDKWAWFGAACLGVFTALTIPIAHAFWAMKEPQAHTEFYTVLEHIAIVGGLMVMAIWAGDRAKAKA